MTSLLLSLLLAPSYPPVEMANFTKLSVREARDLDGCRVRVRFRVGAPAWKAKGVTILGPGEGEDGVERSVQAAGDCEADKGDEVEAVGVLRTRFLPEVGGGSWSFCITAASVRVIEDDWCAAGTPSTVNPRRCKPPSPWRNSPPRFSPGTTSPRRNPSL